MWSSVLIKLLTYGDFILFSTIIILLISFLASLGLRKMDWKSPLLRIFGIFVGISQGKLLALALILIRIMLFWSLILFKKQLTLTYLCFGVVATLILHILIAEIKGMLIDVLFTLVTFGGIYAKGLLDIYQNNIQSRVSIFIMEAAVVVFSLILTLVSAVFCARLMIQRKKDKKEWELRRLWPQGVLIIIGIIIAGIPTYYMNRIDTVLITKNLFQYTEEGRISYYGKSQVTKSGMGSTIRNNNSMTMLADTPLYVENENRMLLPGVISIVQPKLSLTNRLANLSWVYEQDGKYYVENEKLKLPVSDFFLYDGKNTYLFFEPVTITWDNNTLELSPFSYVDVKYNQTITVFNRQTEEYRSITTGICNVTTKMNGGATINLSMDIISKADGQEQMLFLQPNLLEDLQ